jgi:hypothetical protein
MSRSLETSEVKAISERYFASWADRDPDAIAAFHAENSRFCVHLGTEAVIGRGAVRAAAQDVFARFPDFSFEIQRVRYGDDHWVLDWALSSGSIRFDCLDLVELSPDGLVSRKDTFIDAVQLQAAIGGGTR